MAEALLVALSLASNAALPYWIIKRDLGRLEPRELARAWTEASFLAAVLAFGPLSLPVYFAKTRRSFAGFALGLGLCALTLTLQGTALAGLSAVLGVN